MSDSRPPSSVPNPERLRIARELGKLRDTVGGLLNLEQLLSSIKVGPRPLAGVLPDVIASLPQLEGALAELGKLLVARLPDSDTALDSLRQHARPALSTLLDALRAAEKREVNAASRLQLEQVTTTVVRDLECLVELLGLLGDVGHKSPVVLGCSELVAEALRTVQPGSHRVRGFVRLTVEPLPPEIDCLTQPNAFVGLLSHGLRWLVAGDVEATANIRILGEPRQSLRFEMTLGTGTGEVRYLAGRHVIPATELVVHCVAKALGVGFHLSTQPRRVTLDLGSILVTQAP